MEGIARSARKRGNGAEVPEDRAGGMAGGILPWVSQRSCGCPAPLALPTKALAGALPRAGWHWLAFQGPSNPNPQLPAPVCLRPAHK